MDSTAPAPRTLPQAIALLVLLCLGLYAQTFSFPFLSVDDPAYVVDNAHVRDGLTMSSFRWAFTANVLGHWHPITHLSYMLDSTVFGLVPGGFHLTNVLLHTANSILLLLLLVRLTGRTYPSIFVAAVFAVHPLHVESVAWIAERKDVLSAFFALLALLAYERWTRTLRPALYGVALLAFALALTSKAIVVTLPCVMLLLDYWPLNRFNKENPFKCSGMLIAEKIPFFVFSIIASIGTVWASVESHAERSLDALSPMYRMANASVSYATYVFKTFWPSNLVAFYPHWGDDLPKLKILLSVVFLLVVTSMAIVQWKRRPYLIVGWLWFIGMIVPVSGLFQVGDQAMADRYMYLSQIGLSIAIVWAAAEFLDFANVPQKARWAMSAGVIVVFSILTWNQTRLWGDTIGLYEHALARTPDNTFTRQVLANSHMLADQPEHAEAHYRAALEMSPGHPDWTNSLGYALLLQGQESEAETLFREATELNPNHADAWNNLGIVSLERKEFRKAGEYFQQVVALRPGAEGPILNWAIASAGLGEFEQAERLFVEAIRIDPESIRARYNLAAMLFEEDRPDESLQYVDWILGRVPTHEGALGLREKLIDGAAIP